MLVRFTNDDFEPKGRVAIALAIHKYKDGAEYMCFSNDFQVHPYICQAKDVTVLDAGMPSDWKEVSHETEDGASYSIQSFPRWAEEPLFLNWLMEDEWQPEKTREAAEIVRAKLEECVDFYAGRKAGSAKRAKEALLKSRFERQLKDHTDRGYERPAEPDLSENSLSEVDLAIEVLGELYERPTPVNGRSSK